MAIELTKADWTIDSDPGVSRVSGGINPTNPSSNFSLRLPVDALPISEGGFTFTAIPSSVISLLTTTQFVEMWMKAVQLAASVDLDAGVIARFVDGQYLYFYVVKYQPPVRTLYLIAIDFSGPTVMVLFSEILSGALTDSVGLRFQCADDVGGVRVSISVNLNGAGWIEKYDAVDVGGSAIAGLPGVVLFGAGLQSGTPGVGDRLYFDDFTTDAIAPS